MAKPIRFTDDELRAIALVSFGALETVTVPGATIDEITPDDIDGIGCEISAPFELVTALRKIRAAGLWAPDSACTGLSEGLE